MRYVPYSVFSVVVVKSIIWRLSCDLMSPLFGVFSRGSLVKETAATSGKVSQRLVKR